MSPKKKVKVTSKHPQGAKKSPVIKRSIVILGHKTSVSLEDKFWRRLKIEAAEHVVTLSSLVGKIDRDRKHSNLSSAIRLHVVDQLEQMAGVADNQKGSP